MADKKATARSSKNRTFPGYMTYVLEKEKAPTSVYKFCSSLDVAKDQFYAHHGSIENLRISIWLV